MDKKQILKGAKRLQATVDYGAASVRANLATDLSDVQKGEMSVKKASSLYKDAYEVSIEPVTLDDQSVRL